MTVGFLYLVTILFVAARWGLPEALAGSFGATFLLNLLFLPPVGTLNIEDPLNWIALLAFLITSVTASQMSERARRRTREALSGRLEVERLYALSRAILVSDPHQPVGEQITQHVARIYEIPYVALYDRGADHTWLAGADDMPGIQPRLREVAVQGGSIRAAEDQVLVVPVTFGGDPIGSLALTDRLISEAALDALLSLVSLGLAKAHAQEAAIRADVARQSEELKSTLMDALAHELKTPITSIKAAITAILSSTVVELNDRQQALSIIDESVEQLNVLVNEAIHLSRIDAGNLQLKREPCTARALVEDSLYQMRATLDGRAVELSIADDLPAVAVDLELMQLVVRHLIDNAVKYSPPASPVRISAVPDGNSIVIAIRNEGEGISESEMSRIFEKFYRGANARGHVPGTGMGLAIAREIVVAHAGDIWVDSVPGQGAEFVIRLPHARTRTAP